MIFALLDYCQYRLRNGRYSAERFAKMNAFLANPDKIGAIRGAQIGVMFVHPLNSFVSWIIMYVTGGPWSHVALLTGKGTIFEATTAGQMERRPDVYFTSQNYVCVMYRPSTVEQRDKLEEYVKRQTGGGYNFRGAVLLGLNTIATQPPWPVFADALICLAVLAAIVPMRATIPIRTLVLAAIVIYIVVVLFTRYRNKVKSRGMLRLEEEDSHDSH
jgi:hypothetical protein